MGLVIQHEGDLVYSAPEGVGGSTSSERKRTQQWMSQLSFDQRDLEVGVLTRTVCTYVIDIVHLESIP